MVTVLTAAAAAGYPVDPVLYLLFVIGAIHTYKILLLLLITPLLWFWYSKLLPSKILIERHTQAIQVVSNTPIVIVIGKLSSA